MTALPAEIGPYAVECEIGRGGMGVVYLATDSRLGRKVAIKALPEFFKGDPERLARFEREARTLAALNHPNVAGIHGVEEVDGARYLVMEYVDGETLADRLDRGPLPLDEALETCAQIAAGLEAAHDAGVIHRDLKPANIRITPEGKAKVLDFGLARTEETSSSGSSVSQMPTLTTPMSPHSPTTPGAILGTAPYMSPEQARGRKVDKRSDIWSFGVVLYECLTGESPFAGETASDSIGAILHKPFDLRLLPASAPPGVRRVLARCLERDREKRYRDIGDVRIDLASAPTDAASASAGVLADHGVARPSRLRLGAVLLALVAVAVAGVLIGRLLSTSPAPRVRKFEIQMKHAGGFDSAQSAISPDGSMIAYLDLGQIWIRQLDSFDARAVEESEHGISPFWSPDSKWLGFFRGLDLLKVPAGGGKPTLIAQTEGPTSLAGGGAWSRDGRIFYSTGDSAINVVSANGGEPSVYVPLQPPDDDDIHELTLLPDDKTLVFTVHSRTRPWYLAISDGRTRRELLAFDDNTMTPAYSPTGHLLFMRFSESVGLWAVPFSVEKMETIGSPFLVSQNDGAPSVSKNGTLAVTRRRMNVEGGNLVKVDIDTGEQSILAEPAGQHYDPALSPDGSTIALAGFKSGAVDIWLLDLAQGTRTRLTYDAGTNEVLPRWSPDGKTIAYSRTVSSNYERSDADDTIHFIAIDGGGEIRDPISGGYPTLDGDWSHIAFTRISEATGRDIHGMDLNGDSEPFAILASSANEWQPALSPDGRFLAYVSDESGVEQVYITRFPSGEGKWQVSSGIGIFPQWSADGSSLFFAAADVTILEAKISVENRVIVGQPHVVVGSTVMNINPYLGFSPFPGGKSLLVIRGRSYDEPSAVGVIENWFEEFKGRTDQ